MSELLCVLGEMFSYCSLILDFLILSELISLVVGL